MHFLSEGECHFSVENADGIFQIRPFKEFSPANGRERFLSLDRLADALEGPSNSDDQSNSSMQNNAYNFMRSRGRAGGDPAVKRWNASIRMSNFASVESAPLCVRTVNFEQFLPVKLMIVADGFNRCTSRPPC